MRQRKWKLWALVDDADTYLMSVYGTRWEAEKDKADNSHLEDAKWRIIRVEVRELPKARRKG